MPWCRTMTTLSAVASPGDALSRDRSVFVTHHTIDHQSPRRALSTHTFAALAFHVAGTSRCEQRGEFALETGDVLLIPAGEPHRIVEARASEVWGVGFCVPCFATDDAADLLAPFDRVRDGAAPVARLPAERQAFVESLLVELRRSSGRPGEHAVQRSLLTLVLAEVSRAMEHQPLAPTTSGGLVSEALRFIERRCLEPLTLDDVARAVSRSPAHVTTALRRATGKSAVAWIIAHRMAEARRRLLHTDEHVDVIAERVGYADATHFIRLFRREHGATPAAWRAGRR